MKSKLGLKNLAMLPSYFDYIFVHLRQKVRLRPELSPKFMSTSGPKPTRKFRADLQLWGEVSYSASCNVLAVNNKIIYSKISTEDFCFVL